MIPNLTHRKLINEFTNVLATAVEMPAVTFRGQAEETCMEVSGGVLPMDSETSESIWEGARRNIGERLEGVRQT